MRSMASFGVALALAASFAIPGHAQATIDVIMDTGAALGGGGGNPNNGGIFQTGMPPNAPFAVGGVTTAIQAPYFSNQGAGVGTSQSVTYSAMDSVTGAEFTFDVVLTGYQNDNGAISVVGLNETGCCSVGVDSTFSSDTNDQIEADALVGNAGQSEFLRVTVDNVNVTNPGTLTEPLELVGIFGATMRTQTGQGDMGDILVAGIDATVGTDLLVSYDNNIDDQFRHFLNFDPSLGIDIVPTADQAALQGLQIRFQEAQVAAVPEPSSIALWTLIGMTLAGFGFRRLRAAKH